MTQTRFTRQQLTTMLKDLAALAATEEGRRLLATELAGSIRRSKMGSAMLEKVCLMYDYFRDPAEPLKPKLAIGAALLYLVIPTDLIPDWFGLIGFADDFAAISLIWNQLKDVLLHYDERRRARQAAGEGI